MGDEYIILEEQEHGHGQNNIMCILVYARFYDGF